MSSDVTSPAKIMTSSPEMLKNTNLYNKMTAIVTKNSIRQNDVYFVVTGCDVTARNRDVTARKVD